MSEDIWTSVALDPKATQNAPRLTLAPIARDELTGALFVHKDMTRASEPWEDKEHIAPPTGAVPMGDIASWARFVETYGLPPRTVCFWTERGLRATLDYHLPWEDRGDPEDESHVDAWGRSGWHVTLPFEHSSEWLNWTNLVDKTSVGQRTLVEFLEDRASEIVSPDPAVLQGLVRTLRVNVNVKAESVLAPDGTTTVVFVKEQGVRSHDAKLPSEIVIAVPIFRNHVELIDERPRPIIYKVGVRLRVSVSDDGKLAFRLSILRRDQIVEAALESMVGQVRAALSDRYELLRAY